MHHKRWRKWGDPSVKKTVQGTTLEERVWTRVDVRGPDDCWLWTGTDHSNGGYGRLGWEGKHLQASRAVWWLTHGELPPPRVFICHTCDNPPCCNPAHLFRGDAVANNADKLAKGRQVNLFGESNPSARLTEDDVREMRAAHAAGESVPSLARRFDYNDSNLRRIIKRELWKHVV
jgi:hypothetical protein